MILLQYAINLMRLFKLENFGEPSEIFRHAMSTYLISRLSVVVLISLLGQLDGSCENQCGRFQHRVVFDSVVGSLPLELRPAELV